MASKGTDRNALGEAEIGGEELAQVEHSAQKEQLPAQKEQQPAQNAQQPAKKARRSGSRSKKGAAHTKNTAQAAAASAPNIDEKPADELSADPPKTAVEPAVELPTGSPAAEKSGEEQMFSFDKMPDSEKNAAPQHPHTAYTHASAVEEPQSYPGSGEGVEEYYSVNAPAEESPLAYYEEPDVQQTEDKDAKQAKGGSYKKFKRNFSLRGKLGVRELSAFCTQMSMILRAGIPAEEGISIMLEDARDSATQGILLTMQREVDQGARLSDAIAASGVFPQYMIDMAQIGEESGRLDEVMDNLAYYYEREEDIRSSIRSAVAYPMVMVIVMVAVIAVLVVKVLPVFGQVFEQLGGGMSAFSKSVMNFGMATGRYSAIFVGALVVLGLLGAAIWRTVSGRALIMTLLSRLPVTRVLFQKISSSRIASAMSLMLSSGLNPDHALEMAERLVEDPGAAKKLAQCKEKVAQGSALSDALSETGVFTGVYARMVAVGFRTGAVDEVMHKLAIRYSIEVDDQIGSMVAVVEPTLVAVLSIIVGLILLSVMLPLMGIMSSIG